MRKFKTAEDNRTNYIYYFDDGSKCVINPDEDGVDTIIMMAAVKMRMIATLILRIQTLIHWK